MLIFRKCLKMVSALLFAFLEGEMWFTQCKMYVRWGDGLVTKHLWFIGLHRWSVTAGAWALAWQRSALSAWTSTSSCTSACSLTMPLREREQAWPWDSLWWVATTPESSEARTVHSRDLSFTNLKALSSNRSCGLISANAGVLGNCWREWWHIWNKPAVICRWSGEGGWFFSSPIVQVHFVFCQLNFIVLLQFLIK